MNSDDVYGDWDAEEEEWANNKGYAIADGNGDDDSAQQGLYVPTPEESDADRLREMSRNQFLPPTAPVDIDSLTSSDIAQLEQLESLGMVDLYGSGVPTEGAPEMLRRTPQRMPPEHVSLSMLTDDDIRKMAESNTFPDALRGDHGNWWLEGLRDQPVEGEVHGGRWESGDPLEAYRKLDNKYDREDFLVGLRYAMKKKVQNEKIPEWMLSEGSAVAAGVLAGFLIAGTGGALGYAGSGAMLGTGAATGAGTAAFGAAPFLYRNDPEQIEKAKARAAEAAEKRRIKKMTEEQLRDELEAEKAANELLKQSLRTQQK